VASFPAPLGLAPGVSAGLRKKEITTILRYENTTPVEECPPLMPDFIDQTLLCVQCGKEFIFSAGEQRFFKDKNFVNIPKRCKQCKIVRNSSTIHSALQTRQETLATCEQCGRQTTIPFRPTQGRPVYCRECFQGRRASSVTVGG